MFFFVKTQITVSLKKGTKKNQFRTTTYVALEKMRNFYEFLLFLISKRYCFTGIIKICDDVTFLLNYPYLVRLSICLHSCQESVFRNSGIPGFFVIPVPDSGFRKSKIVIPYNYGGHASNNHALSKLQKISCEIE